MNQIINWKLLVFAIGLFLVSCNKAVVDYNSDYTGIWKSEVSNDVQSYMIIGENHNEFGLNCEPNSFNNDCDRFVEGRALVNSSRTKIRIGQSPNTLTLTINEAPYQNDNDEWRCVLNNIILVKQ